MKTVLMKITGYTVVFVAVSVLNLFADNLPSLEEFLAPSVSSLSGSSDGIKTPEAELDNSASADPKTSIYFELGAANDPDALGGTIGVAHEVSDIFTCHGGLSYFASEHSSDVFGGITIGLRTNATALRIMPFVGLGLFTGISKEYVPADNDNEDNDGDGEIDEAGEEEEIIDDVMASVYPEVGVNFMLAKDMGVMVTAKRHYTSEGDELKFWMYSAAFAMYF